MTHLSRFYGLLAAVVAAAVVAVGTPASATVNDEIYACKDNGTGGDRYNIGTCDGLWWHDNTTKRTLRIAFSGVTHDKETGYNNTPLTYVSKTDGDSATLRFYCRNEKYDIKTLVGSIHLGGKDPYNASWPSGWDPCTGDWTGMEVVAQGGYGGVNDICTTVQVNTYYYQFAERGYEQTYPNHGKC